MGNRKMKKGYEQFETELADAIRAFPTLQITVKNAKQILAGTLAIIDSEGKHWEDYNIEIHCCDEFPKRFPILFETSNKIPKIGDWHIYEDTLSCCVKVIPEEILRCKEGITVTEYIREEVLPYLFNQTHRRVEGYYVNGAYSHNEFGIYEFYAALLKTGNDIRRTVQLMEYIAMHEKPLRTSRCFCGNGQKFRHCHREAFNTLKKIGDDIVQVHAQKIVSMTFPFHRSV